MMRESGMMPFDLYHHEPARPAERLQVKGDEEHVHLFHPANRCSVPTRFQGKVSGAGDEKKECQDFQTVYL